MLSLLLLVLLENAGRRNTEAMQEKLNVLAEALAALMESRAADDPELREAVGGPPRGGRARGTPLTTVARRRSAREQAQRLLARG